MFASRVFAGIVLAAPVAPASLLDGLKSAADQAGYAVIGHDAATVELLYHGLSFDLSLAAKPLAATSAEAILNWQGDIESSVMLNLVPGAHIVGGAFQLPIVLAALELAVAVSRAVGGSAVVWGASAVLTGVDLAGQLLADRRSGGPLPVPMLTRFSADGATLLVTHGLRLLIGKELRLQPLPGASSKTARQIMLRFADWMIEHNGQYQPDADISLSGGTLVTLSPAGEDVLAQVLPR